MSRRARSRYNEEVLTRIRDAIGFEGKLRVVEYVSVALDVVRDGR